MKKNIPFLLILIFWNSEKNQYDYNFTTVFESSYGKETATNQQSISYYKNLAEPYPEISIQ